MGRKRLSGLVALIVMLAFLATGCNTAETSFVIYGSEETPTSETPQTLAPEVVATPTPTDTPTPTPSPSPTLPPQRINCTFLGDCTLADALAWSGSAGSFDAVVAANGMDYCFQNAAELLSQDDLTLANFEGAITDATGHLNKEFVFGSPFEYTEMLTGASIEAVNLANNHSYDYLQEGLEDTRAAMEEVGILWSDQSNYAIYEVNGVKIGMCGLDTVSNIGAGASSVYPLIDQMREEGANIIIVSCHWGYERDYDPRSDQIQIGHDLIDYGVDIVVGTHPHRLQPIEEYNGHYILYCLSNFCFGGNTSLSDPDSVIIQCEILMDPTNSYAEDYRLNVIPYCQTSTRPGNDYCPRPYDPGTDDYERVLERLHWVNADE